MIVREASLNKHIRQIISKLHIVPHVQINHPIMIKMMFGIWELQDNKHHITTPRIPDSNMSRETNTIILKIRGDHKIILDHPHDIPIETTVTQPIGMIQTNTTLIPNITEAVFTEQGTYPMMLPQIEIPSRLTGITTLMMELRVMQILLTETRVMQILLTEVRVMRTLLTGLRVMQIPPIELRVMQILRMEALVAQTRQTEVMDMPVHLVVEAVAQTLRVEEDPQDLLVEVAHQALQEEEDLQALQAEVTLDPLGETEEAATQVHLVVEADLQDLLMEAEEDTPTDLQADKIPTVTETFHHLIQEDTHLVAHRAEMTLTQTEEIRVTLPMQAAMTIDTNNANVGVHQDVKPHARNRNSSHSYSRET